MCLVYARHRCCAGQSGAISGSKIARRNAQRPNRFYRDLAVHPRLRLNTRCHAELCARVARFTGITVFSNQRDEPRLQAIMWQNFDIRPGRPSFQRMTWQISSALFLLRAAKIFLVPVASPLSFSFGSQTTCHVLTLMVRMFNELTGSRNDRSLAKKAKLHVESTRERQCSVSPT